MSHAKRRYGVLVTSFPGGVVNDHLSDALIVSPAGFLKILSMA